MAQAALTPTEKSTPKTQPSQPLSDKKVTLDNLSSWDEAFAEAKKEAGEDGTNEEGTEEVREEALEEEEVKAEGGADAVTTEEGTEKKADEDGAEKAESTEGADAKGEKKAPRDLSKFPEQDRPFLKQMSRQAFEHIGGQLLKLQADVAAKDEVIKEFSDGKTLPDQWYNDPAAAEATPEFKAAKTEFEKAQAETHRLGSLLDQYEAGQIKYNAATNTFVPNDDEAAVDPRMVRMLSDARMQAFEKQKEHAAKGNEVVSNFGKHYTAAESHVTTNLAKLFPWSKDEKHENQKYLQQIHNEWPKVFRSHPAAKFASALAVEHIRLKTAFEELKKKSQAKESLKTAKKAAGPIPGRNGRVSNADADKKLTLADFE